MPSACFAAIGNVQRITQHAEGMSLRYDEIAAFETLFRATFVRMSTLFRATFVQS